MSLAEKNLKKQNTSAGGRLEAEHVKQVVNAEKHAAEDALRSAKKAEKTKEKMQKQTDRLLSADAAVLVHDEKKRAKQLLAHNRASEAAARRALLKKAKGVVRNAYRSSMEYRIKEIAKEQKFFKQRWFRLDNAGLIYPALAREATAQFRAAATLYEPIDPLALQRALNDVVPRFPTITNSLKAGVFWYYLDVPNSPLVIEKGSGLPCRPIRLDHRRSMIRVTYTKFEIAIEFFHTATDGHGGIVLFNTLLAAYFRHTKGLIVPPSPICPHYLDIPMREEMEDAFQSVRVPGAPRTEKNVKAAHLKGEKLPKSIVSFRKGTCSSDNLVAAAKAHGATVTQFLVACYLEAAARHMRETDNKSKRPIRLSIPCDLRKIYNRDTLRNFSSYFYAEYVPDVDFNTLLEKVKEQFKRQVNRAYFDGMINFNTKSQHNPVVMLAPLPLKNIILKAVYKLLGYSLNSGSFSNVGIVTSPKEFEPHIARYYFGFGAMFCEPVGLTMSSYKGLTTLVLNSVLRDALFERLFFGLLTDMGVELCIESNIDGGNAK